MSETTKPNPDPVDQFKQTSVRPDDPPAFPVTGNEYINNSDPQPTVGLFGGMTLRDYFAAKAITGAAHEFWNFVRTDADYKKWAECAYLMADAMLDERMKQQS